MALFGTKPVKEITFKECEKLLEEFFNKVGLDISQHRLQNQKNAWWAQRGSAYIYIYLEELQNMKTLRIISPILYLPHENLLPFYRACLEYNYSLINCSFSVNKDIVMLVCERPVLGLTAEEIEDIMNMLSHYADRFDNELAAEFGAKIYSEKHGG